MKKAPYILLLALFVILIFIVGVRYGQRVERANKSIDYVLSLTPTLSPTTPTPQVVTYDTYSHQGCRVSFLYSSVLQLERQTATAALFTMSGSPALTLQCLASPPVTSAKKGETVPITFQGKSIAAEKRKVGASNLLVFTLTHPTTGRSLEFAVAPSQYPLLEKSLTYSVPIPTATPAPTQKVASPSAQ